MAMLTVRNLPDEIHRALRVKAALNGRSMEAEVRAILASAVADNAATAETKDRRIDTHSGKD